MKPPRPPRPLSANLKQVFDQLDHDWCPLAELYNRLGFSTTVAARLYFLEKRGLVERREHGGAREDVEWRRVLIL